MSKYNSRKVSYEVNGVNHVFDSALERDRYLYLKDLGLEIELQPKFVLIDGFVRNDSKIRACHYIADFKYSKDGHDVVEDIKGMKTDVYLLKRKLLLSRYPHLFFIEVTRKRGEWYEDIF